MKNEILTKNDVKKIEDEIRHRKLDVRPKALEDVKVARAQGDLSENFEYYAAKKFNRENNSRIEYLEKMLKNANIIEDIDNDGICINNTVKIKYLDDNEYAIYKIVTSIRSDSMQNKISIESPLGKSLLNKNVGDVVNVLLENGNSYKIEVIDIKKEDIGEDKIKQF